MLGTVGTITNSFTVGDTVTGQTNGAVGTVVAIAAGNMSVDVIDGKFEVGEVITNDKVPQASTSILTITQRPLIMDYADLVLAADMQSAFVFQRRNSLGIRSISMEGGSIQTFEKVDLIPAVRSIIRRYKRV